MIRLKLEDLRLQFSSFSNSEHAYFILKEEKKHATQVLWGLSAVFLGVAVRKNHITCDFSQVPVNSGPFTTQLAEMFSWWLFNKPRPSLSDTEQFGRYMSLSLHFIAFPFDQLELEIYDLLYHHVTTDIAVTILELRVYQEIPEGFKPRILLLLVWAKFVRFAQHFHLGNGVPGDILKRAILEYAVTEKYICEWFNNN